MKAYNKYHFLEVEEADKYVKKAMPNAEYMCVSKSYTIVFIKDKNGEYLINDDYYKSIGINDHDYLVNNY